MRTPYYKIRSINEDALTFELCLFWPVNRKDIKGIAYEDFDSVNIEWHLSYDADEIEGRLVDWSGLSPSFSQSSCSDVERFYDSPLGDLDLAVVPACGGMSLNDCIEYVKRLVDEKIKTIKPMRRLPQKPILTFSNNYQIWNHNYRKKINVCGFNMVFYKDGRIHSSDATCYELIVKNKLTEKDITSLSNAGVKHGSVFEEYPPRLEETEKGFHYFWSYSHSTE